MNIKSGYLLAFFSFCLLGIFCAFKISGKDDYEQNRKQIMLREIGHELLLQAGDRSSRVMPIRIISAEEYQIAFENEFSFKPDSLVALIDKVLKKGRLNDHYLVRVMDGQDQEVTFGYLSQGSQTEDVKPCSGRVQPKSCYLIDIQFQKKQLNDLQKGYLLGSLPVLAFIGLWLLKKDPKQLPEAKASLSDEIIKLANTRFDLEKKRLHYFNNEIQLTTKECRILSILIKEPNVVVERNRLQKEIWEDEGVIVGRSLDMFISRLRKKLEQDSGISVTNIHGKGYKLELVEPV